MNLLDQIISEMDFDFLSSGKHTMNVEGMRKCLGDNDTVFIDVRTGKEIGYVSFPFATHIPMNELPERISEVPRDKQVVLFCSSVFRAAVSYTYLRANGFERVKGMAASMEDMVQAFKPGPLGKM
ncbi:rhodanese-like domain-containing protein [Maridesulfovibrio sp.]|uniref:rhodanese-like domain-containing protein n=1 Tax=Maridesulfovibrio sp. TaxID=2795000 RepID=UPI002A187678|nr:rhodanese-like domain-containing protein [Maridesulfovibrio sp.]